MRPTEMTWALIALLLLTATDGSQVLKNDEATWRLTETGAKLSKEPDLNALRMLSFAKQYKALRGTRLVREVYQRYPYYAIRSEIIDQVLPSAKDREKVDAARPSRKTP